MKKLKSGFINDITFKTKMTMEIEKISISKCKTTLEKDGSVYTDEEVSQLRDFLYMLAELDYKVFLKTQK